MSAAASPTPSPPIHTDELIEALKPAAWRWRNIYSNRSSYWMVRQRPIEAREPSGRQAGVEVEPLYTAEALTRLTSTPRPQEAAVEAREQIEAAFKEAYQLGFLEGYECEPHCDARDPEYREAALRHCDGVSEAWSDYAAALRSPRSADQGMLEEWQPIETAPKDGTPIWAYREGPGSSSLFHTTWDTVVAVAWSNYETDEGTEEGWAWPDRPYDQHDRDAYASAVDDGDYWLVRPDEKDGFTHWMPLPNPPAALRKSSNEGVR